MTPVEFISEIRDFKEFEESSVEGKFLNSSIPVFTNEFWTSKKRASHSLHEISYRACFKSQLPEFFIKRLTVPYDTVYDPFSGRGTTLLESSFLSRFSVGCDISPLSKMLIEPRLHPPDVSDVKARLDQIDLEKEVEDFNSHKRLLVFYHPATLRQICNLRNYLIEREVQGKTDYLDRWIRLVATNRLTGHSIGFFSVYTLPPNQTVSIKSQERINQRKKQPSIEKDVRKLIVAKSITLLRSVTIKQLFTLSQMRRRTLFFTQSSCATPQIRDASINLVVTSPPFLDITDYHKDNWLRCWFNNIDLSSIDYWKIHDINEWKIAMWSVFRELYRIVVPGGYVAFEVGEVRKGSVCLENSVVPVAQSCGFTPVTVLINRQVFTKTSNCWGVDNHNRGTNSNRICVFFKE
jgi:hypothetical protein